VAGVTVARNVYSAVFWAIVGASVLHIGEECAYPGGFLAAMRALTGAALYVPLSVTAYAVAIHDEHVGLGIAVAAIALGLGWNAIPPLYLFTSSHSR
jgi:hypothetical protein